MPIIAPSLLSSNFLRLEDDCNMLNQSQADWFHLDIMDGRFVPNISFGLPVVQHIRKATSKVLDVHLMIVEPEKYATNFKDAGADILTVHIETCNHLHRNIQQIKNLGMKVGVALNPHTSIVLLDDILEEIDLVCLMSVNPGFGGQMFIENTLYKISKLKNRILQRNLHTLIEIDGGVTFENASTILKEGADVLVAGNTVFKSSNPIAAIEKLKSVSIK